MSKNGYSKRKRRYTDKHGSPKSTPARGVRRCESKQYDAFHPTIFYELQSCLICSYVVVRILAVAGVGATTTVCGDEMRRLR